MKVCIHTNGCAVLKHETERIAKFFHLNKVEVIECPEDGDIIVMMCCGVTHNEENQAIDIITDLNSRKQNDTTLIVSGCLPAFASERILEAAPEAQIMSYSQMRNFDNIVSSSVAWDNVYYNYGHMMKQEEHRDDTIHISKQDLDLQLMETVDETNHTSNCVQQYSFCTLRKYIWQDEDVYQIKVVYGCPGHCNYCATKLAIGEFHSVQKTLILKQSKEGITSGFKRFSLIGDEIGCYGTDFGENIVKLLDDVYSLNSDITVSVRYIHPDIFVRYYEGLKPYLINGFIDFLC